MSDSTLSKVRINLYSRPLSSGNKSLYLDYYNGDKRIREPLNLYLLPETTRKNIRQNKETMKKAQELQRIRLEELTAKDNEIELEPEYPDVPLGDLMKEYHTIFKEKGSQSTSHNISHLINYLRLYRGLDINLKDIDYEYCDSLVDYLLNDCKTIFGKLKMTTARTYIYLFSGALNMAVEKGFIPENPLRKVTIHTRITRERPEKKFLTTDEIKSLMETQCPVISRPQVKQAYLFSIFTGLTLPDILSLRLKHIKEEQNGRKKVWCRSRNIFVPLSSNALKWIPQTSRKTGPVFTGLPKDTEINNILKAWQTKAGIEKRINFTLARNTFAYLILSTGTDVATFCSLMGIKSKQAGGYLKMVDYKPTTIDEKFEFLNLN